MQQIPLILLTLALLALLLLSLRARWHRLRSSTRTLLLAASILAICIFGACYAKHWSTASDRLNSAVYLAAVAGYLLLLTVHSLNRPRWLTALTSLILAAPIFGSSLFLPIGGLFSPSPTRVLPLGQNLYVSWQEFTEFKPPPSGVDVDIFYRPPSLPFFKHSRLSGRFYNQRCNAKATEVTLEPDAHSVFILCPSWPNSPDPSGGEVVRLH